jgi:hypothetical protein
MKRSHWIVGFLFATLCSGCAYQHAPLVTPTVTLTESTSKGQMQQAVRKTLVNRGWKIDSETLGSTTAHIQQNKLFANIRVDYDEKQATVRHLDSQNLNYEKSVNGEERIHNHYNFWANSIVNDIRKDLNPSAPVASR